MTDAVLSPTSPSRPAPAAKLAAGVRIAEIDMLRGLVIVLMALDHTRDYVHIGALTVNPLDPAQTTPWLYVTRWITHLCAPTFVFLAGVSAYLQFAKGKSAPNLSMFLLTRGLWLIVLELTVLSIGWSFAFPPFPFFQVIWAIGWSMIALAGLIWLPRVAVLLIGLAIVGGHNLLDPISAQQFGAWGPLWQLVHDGGPIFLTQGPPAALAAYPVLPWMGVIALGYGLGALFASPPAQRDRTLFLLGLAMLAAFFALRWFETYGNPPPGAGPFDIGSWRDEQSFGAAAMVFLNVQKYPPSLQFILVTLGAVFTLWPLLARLRGPIGSVLNTFGAVPFFFYVLHIYLVHIMAIAANAAAGKPTEGHFNYMLNLFTAPQLFQGAGFTLPWVYAVWILVLALLYPLCRYWQGLKQRRRDWWLSYL